MDIVQCRLSEDGVEPPRREGVVAEHAVRDGSDASECGDPVREGSCWHFCLERELFAEGLGVSCTERIRADLQ